jgi:hypothetical protein
MYLAERWSRYGSVVVLYTHIGEITLDGDAISFHEALKGAFSRAGFKVDTQGRRLLGVIEMLGMFKLLKAGINTTGTDQGNSGVGTMKDLPAMIPTTYTAIVEETEFCVNDDGENTYNCEQPGAGMVNWVSEPVPGRKAVQAQEKQFSLRYNGSPVAKNIKTKGRWPGQQLVQVYNETHKMTFQTYQGLNYHCKLEADASLKMVANTRRELSDPEANNIQVLFKGYETVNGVYCKRFDIISTKSQNYTLYEDYVKRQIYQVSFKSMYWRFLSLEAVPNEASNPVPFSEFDMDVMLANCDDPTRVPPPQLMIGLVSDIIVPTPEWGAKLPDVDTNSTNSTAGTSRRGLSKDYDRLLMTMDEYWVWRKAEGYQDIYTNTSGSVDIQQASCISGRTFNMLPSDFSGYFKSIQDIKSTRASAESRARKAPEIYLAMEACGKDDLSFYVGGSATVRRCIRLSGEVEISASRLSTSSPRTSAGGKLTATANICDCLSMGLPVPESV